MTLRHCLTLLTALLLVGCHGKFKAAAPSISAVKVKVVASGGPRVELGKVDDGGLVGLVVNVVQEVKAEELRRRIERAVHIPDVKDSLHRGIATSLGDGPPFAYTRDTSAQALLQLDIRRYGMVVPQLGAPGSFDFIAKLKIYNRQSERIYKKRLRCRTGVGDPSATSVVLGAVNNVRQVKKMSDEEINQVFVDVAHYCGERFVLKMRKHASP